VLIASCTSNGHFLVTTLEQPLNIRGVTLPNRVFLAPMSGVSDLPFRKRAAEAGAGMVVSEMVASAELCNRHKESMLRLSGEGAKRTGWAKQPSSPKARARILSTSIWAALPRK
jgi:tRNA-dihydrouridine synthase